MKLSDIILNEELNVARRKLEKLAQNIGFEEFAKVILSLADENILDDIADAMNFSNDDNTSYYNPDVLREEYKVAGRKVKVNKGKKSDGTDWSVTFPNGKSTSLASVLALIEPKPELTKEEEDKFAGQDPRAGSTIKGTGFMAPRQKTKKENRYNEGGYEEGEIKLMGDLILPIDKQIVLQAEEDKYNRGLLVTNNKDKSYDIAYWADTFEPYPIEVEIDGKSVAKEAKVIKLLFHPEMD